MIQNSWSGDSTNASATGSENKMHELTVVNHTQNLQQPNSANNFTSFELNTSTSNQLPLKYTVLQDADSTVLDNYNFNDQTNQNADAYRMMDTAYETNSVANLMNVANSYAHSINNDQLEQQVYYDQQSAVNKANEPIYSADYPYNDQVVQSNQINQFNDQLITNQSYDYSAPNETLRNSTHSTPSVNSSFSNSSNSSNSAHSSQLSDLNAVYSAAAGKANSYHYSNQYSKTKNQQLDQTNKIQHSSSSLQANRTNQHNNHQQSRAIHSKHYSSNKTGTDRKLLRPHSTPATLLWLEENYEIADGVCIPRSTLYMHYVDFCSKNCIQPVNAASFGKIIRQQFPQLTTRRLGTRGQSR